MYTIIEKERLNAMLIQEELSGQESLEIVCFSKEIDGRQYSIWRDVGTGEEYAVRDVRTVYMGFNSNEEGKVDEFIDIVEHEGACYASWGVAGRTAHKTLALKLEAQLPQYEFEIDYDLYRCLARKRAPEMMPMPGTTDPDWGRKHWGE